MKNRRPTLQDIADRVGATKMTVSRCLRTPDTVSENLRDRIFAVAEELGYIPNRGPNILSKATSRAIGVLLPTRLFPITGLCPQVDPALGGVLIDLFQLFIRERPVFQRTDTVFQLAHATGADQGGRYP